MAPSKKNRKNNKNTAPKKSEVIAEEKITEKSEQITVEPSQDSIQEMRIREDSQITLNNDNEALLNAKIADIVFEIKKDENEPQATVHSLRSANDANLEPKEKSGQHLELSIESKKQVGYSQGELSQGETDFTTKTTENLEGTVTEFDGATKDLYKKSYEERIEETGISVEAPEVTAFIDSINTNQVQPNEEKVNSSEGNESFVNVEEATKEKDAEQTDVNFSNFTAVQPTITLSEVYDSKAKNIEPEPESEELKNSDLQNYSQTENIEPIESIQSTLIESIEVTYSQGQYKEVTYLTNQHCEKRDSDLVETVIKEVYESDIQISAVDQMTPALPNVSEKESHVHQTIDTIEFIENESHAKTLGKSNLATGNQQLDEPTTEANDKTDTALFTKPDLVVHQNLSDVNVTIQRKNSNRVEPQGENNYLFVATIVTATALSGYLFFKGIKALTR